ncbi:MAG: HlyD family efflux transporter periplasmic adaptor subunit [Anaerolineae bacterium]|nr:HlyD family efflux transporter periplasmic adaptor subunit [Anaerolineae bacterium]
MMQLTPSSKRVSLLILFLAIFLLVACQENEPLPPTPTPTNSTALDTSSEFSGGRIRALGTIRPAHQLKLSFTVSGPLEAIPIELGSTVQANDILAQLDTSELDLSLQEAQANVVTQQALLKQAITENEQQIPQAEINLQAKALQLEKARLDGPDAAVAIAQTNLDQVDLEISQSKAQSALPDIAAAEAELRRAEVLYGQAKEDYDRVLNQHWRTQEELDPYGLALVQAEADLKRAQASLTAAQNSQQAHGLGVDVLDTEKEKVEVELNQQLNNQQSYRVSLAILAAEVEAAQLELNNLQAQRADYQDQTDETITQAEARLRQAQLAVKRLEQQLQDATLHAPFNGLISAVYLHHGEWAQAGAPVVEVIDTGRWRVETKNVSELDIARIKIGQEAQVRVMAFPNEVVKGKVLTISPVAVVQQGDTTYTLVIELEDTPLNLLPGMNVQVEILADEL